MDKFPKSGSEWQKLLVGIVTGEVVVDGQVRQVGDLVSSVSSDVSNSVDVRSCVCNASVERIEGADSKAEKSSKE
jgi:hypothetical protein